jgi:hypothetical protein
VLYLVQPHDGVKWDDTPGARATIEEARQRSEVDLLRLDWKESERLLTEDGIRVAIRHGVACRTGIVVEGEHLVRLWHPQEIRKTARDAQLARHALAPQEALIESVLPGSTEYSRQLDAAVAKSTGQAIREAEADAAALLAAPVKPELVAHWESLGGRVPEPA